MARPKFHVQHFVTCPQVTVTRAEPGNPYTLHNVRYMFDFPADREFPVGGPDRLWLRCVRRDFDRIAYLAKKRKWADDTCVPHDVFGPMWPKGFVPLWAAGRN